MLESGEIKDQAEIARQESLSRARVTQIMSLLRLAPEIQDYILNLPKSSRRPTITDRFLRPISGIKDDRRQIEKFQELLRS